MGRKITLIDRICPICYKGFKTHPSHNTKRCSSSCYWKSKLGKHPWNKGVPMPISMKERIRQTLKGKSYLTEDGRRRLSEKLSSRRKGKTILKQSGKYHYNWKGGVTPENERIRMSMEAKEWKRKVLIRDDYTCQECKQRGVRLHIDHIKPFAYFPELRFELSNGRTLCERCHRKTPTWGYGATRLYKGGANEKLKNI